MIASPAPAATGAGFMEARTIEAAAAGEAANGKLDRFAVWSTAAVDTRGCLEAAYEIESSLQWQDMVVTSRVSVDIYLEFTVFFVVDN